MDQRTDAKIEAANDALMEGRARARVTPEDTAASVDPTSTDADAKPGDTDFDPQDQC